MEDSWQFLSHSSSLCFQSVLFLGFLYPLFFLPSKFPTGSASALCTQLHPQHEAHPVAQGPHWSTKDLGAHLSAQTCSWESRGSARFTFCPRYATASNEDTLWHKRKENAWYCSTKGMNNNILKIQVLLCCPRRERAAKVGVGRGGAVSLQGNAILRPVKAMVNSDP